MKIIRDIETKFWQMIADRVISIGNQTNDPKIIEILFLNGLMIDTYLVNKGIYLN